jgi:signal transduction histidine kinase
MGQMLSVFTHECRNLLQLSQANLEMLSLELEDMKSSSSMCFEQAQYHLDRAQGAHNKMRRLFEDLRRFSAAIVLEPEACNMGQVLQQAVRDVTAAAPEKHIRVDCITNGTDLRCQADPLRMDQVFCNLLENSVAACPEVVAIQIDWRHTQLGQQPALQITLSDNGPGFSAEQRQRAFEPFYTTKSQGTGLGLAITKRIIEAHGGQITIADTGNDGAQFRITLPRGLAEGVGRSSSANHWA